MTRSVSIFGLGYVGAVTAACLAQKGNRVLGKDFSNRGAERVANTRCSAD